MQNTVQPFQPQSCPGLSSTEQPARPAHALQDLRENKIAPHRAEGILAPLGHHRALEGRLEHDRRVGEG
ncbi:hypothetical protein JZ751_006922 [Albula glossodonta]|uniref:Uncharacterized protein n=1 Tax=Albula glossodonta TaxID=121402 RepID=A0A8T2P5Q9_9TELE|nr:hypothetical protein JZ751_006922 [Albula glossodonta]